MRGHSYSASTPGFTASSRCPRPALNNSSRTLAFSYTHVDARACCPQATVSTATVTSTLTRACLVHPLGLANHFQTFDMLDLQGFYPSHPTIYYRHYSRSRSSSRNATEFNRALLCDVLRGMYLGVIHTAYHDLASREQNSHPTMGTIRNSHVSQVS